MVNVSIHPSQHPQCVENELLRCLNARSVNPKFHYLTYKQSEKWLRLHAAYSPSRIDPKCAAIYDEAFAAIAGLVSTPLVELIGLGCGGGQKDARILRALCAPDRDISYVPCDASVALVLTAREAALGASPRAQCYPLVCDLASADMSEALASLAYQRGNAPEHSRVISFFGMVPNFEPSVIFPRIAPLLTGSSWLLLSANLAPGPDYDAGMRTILPGYDNALTRDWLLQFLFDIGVEPSDGTIQFGVEEGEANLKRVTADFQFASDQAFTVQGRDFNFASGEKIRLFYSYRYTAARMAASLDLHGIEVLRQWATPSDEEAVFLCRRSQPP